MSSPYVLPLDLVVIVSGVGLLINEVRKRRQLSCLGDRTVAILCAPSLPALYFARRLDSPPEDSQWVDPEILKHGPLHPAAEPSESLFITEMNYGLNPLYWGTLWLTAKDLYQRHGDQLINWSQNTSETLAEGPMCEMTDHGKTVWTSTALFVDNTKYEKKSFSNETQCSFWKVGPNRLAVVESRISDFNILDSKTSLKLFPLDVKNPSAIDSACNVRLERSSPPTFFGYVGAGSFKLFFAGDDLEVKTYKKPEGVGMARKVVGNQQHIAGLFWVEKQGERLYARIGEDWLNIPLLPDPKVNDKLLIAASGDKLAVFSENTIGLWSFATKNWLHQRPGKYRPQKLLFNGRQLFAIETCRTTVIDQTVLNNIEKALGATRT